MRVFFAMTGQLWYGGVVQQSILLIRHLRRLGCQVLPFAAVVPPHNDETPPELLDYELGFNVGDLRPAPEAVSAPLAGGPKRTVTRTFELVVAL